MTHTICLTFDFDAVSPWIHSFDAANQPTKLSRGLFGVYVGTPRLLELLNEYDIDTTWFVPGHTIESFPEHVEKVYSSGHDIQHHGWSHTRPQAYDTSTEEQADIQRGIDSIIELTGRRPTGYRSPSWEFSINTLELLESLGFEWDSSQMATDFTPYYLRSDWSAPIDEPYARGTESSIIEIPVSWHRDDFPAFEYSRERGLSNERAIFRQWQEQLDWMMNNLDVGTFVLTMHPQVIGRSHRIRRLETFLKHIQKTQKVRFATIQEVVDQFTSSNRRLI
jgi:peptidoglycan/xylan/chitin deacetylase (PgdA/CDA1 family)